MGLSKDTPTAGGQLCPHGRVVVAGTLDVYQKRMDMCGGVLFCKLVQRGPVNSLVLTFVSSAGTLRAL